VTRLLLMSLPHNVHADYEAEQQGRKANHSPPPSAGSENEWSCIPNNDATNRIQNRLTPTNTKSNRNAFSADANKIQPEDTTSPPCDN